MLLFSVSFDSVLLLRFSAPVFFPLCLDESPAIVKLRTVLSPVLAYVSVERRIVYLFLLNGSDVFVEPFLAFSVSHFVERVRISDVCSVELEVRGTVYHELFWWSRFLDV